MFENCPHRWIEKRSVLRENYCVVGSTIIAAPDNLSGKLLPPRGYNIRCICGSKVNLEVLKILKDFPQASYPYRAE